MDDSGVGAGFGLVDAVHDQTGYVLLLLLQLLNQQQLLAGILNCYRHLALIGIDYLDTPESLQLHAPFEDLHDLPFLHKAQLYKMALFYIQTLFQLTSEIVDRFIFLDYQFHLAGVDLAVHLAVPDEIDRHWKALWNG